MSAMMIVIYVISGVAFAVGIFFLVRALKQSADKAAKQSSKLKKQMTSNIAHELRTPVTSIRGYLETLIACPDMAPEKKQAFIEKAYNQTLRLSELISDMSLLSKMEERSAKLNKEEVDMYDIANEVFDEFEEKICANGNVVENLLINPLARYLFDHEIFENAAITIENIDNDANPPALECRKD